MRDKTSLASWLGQQTFGIAAAGLDAEHLPFPSSSPVAGTAHRRT